MYLSLEVKAELHNDDLPQIVVLFLLYQVKARKREGL